MIAVFLISRYSVKSNYDRPTHWKVFLVMVRQMEPSEEGVGEDGLCIGQSSLEGLGRYARYNM